MVQLPNLKRERERKMLSQQELADKTGVSRFTVQRIEGGGGARPITGRSLARALGVSVEELVRACPDNRTEEE